jgi:hypothetical protein
MRDGGVAMLRLGRIWIVSGLLALGLAAVGWSLASAGDTTTGNDTSGGLFSSRLGL